MVEELKIFTATIFVYSAKKHPCSEHMEKENWIEYIEIGGNFNLTINSNSRALRV